METKTLLEVDARIAKLRDDIAAGTSNKTSNEELNQLLEMRSALIRTNAPKVDDRSPHSTTSLSAARGNLRD